MSSTTIRVGILGATGSVGQRFIQLLEGHPYFEVAALGGSDRSQGKAYSNIVQWKMTTPLPSKVAAIVVGDCYPKHFLDAGCRLVFSGLDSGIAEEVEHQFAEAGIAVFSNAKTHRMDDDVPILIPYVNAEHIDIVSHQKKARGYEGHGGFIVTNANCSSTGLVIAIKAIQQKFGIDQMFVFTMQAVSGAGFFPGISSMDILDNVIPYIDGEEGKLEIEPKKILGKLSEDKSQFIYDDMRISAHCNRVAVLDGHTECVSIKLKNKGSVAEVVEALKAFKSDVQELNLPSSPDQALVVLEQRDRPQPRLDREINKGYTVTVGRVREDDLFDIKLTLLSHNTVIGAAGGSILNAELAKVKGYLD